MKFCKDCIHCVGLADGGKCELAEMVDLVTGKVGLFGCSAERNFGKCGKEGKNFQPILQPMAVMCQNCKERVAMEHTPFCEVCRDEMEDRYAAEQKELRERGEI